MSGFPQQIVLEWTTFTNSSKSSLVRIFLNFFKLSHPGVSKFVTILSRTLSDHDVLLFTVIDLVIIGFLVQSCLLSCKCTILIDSPPVFINVHPKGRLSVLTDFTKSANAVVEFLFI